MRRLPLWIPLIITVASGALTAQAPASGATSAPALPVGSGAPFEVASIKRSPENAAYTRPGSPEPGGRWLAQNATLLMILQRAYPTFAQPGMIVDGPRWIRELKFDVDARAGRDVARADYPAMIQRLLADRFNLRTHLEQRPIDVYALVLARADGRLGPRLKRASAACLAELEAERQRRAATPGPIVMSTGDKQPCGGTLSGLVNGVTRMNGARSIDALSSGLQAFMDQRVVNRTALEGIYELDLEFDYAALRSITVDTAAPERAGLNVFTAVQEQLGLKLEPRREAMEVLVIDNVELPQAN